MKKKNIRPMITSLLIIGSLVGCSEVKDDNKTDEKVPGGDTTPTPEKPDQPAEPEKPGGSETEKPDEKDPVGPENPGGGDTGGDPAGPDNPGGGESGGDPVGPDNPGGGAGGDPVGPDNPGGGESGGDQTETQTATITLTNDNQYGTAKLSSTNPLVGSDVELYVRPKFGFKPIVKINEQIKELNKGNLSFKPDAETSVDVSYETIKPYEIGKPSKYEEAKTYFVTNKTQIAQDLNDKYGLTVSFDDPFKFGTFTFPYDNQAEMEAIAAKLEIVLPAEYSKTAAFTGFYTVGNNEIEYKVDGTIDLDTFSSVNTVAQITSIVRFIDFQEFPIKEDDFNKVKAYLEPNVFSSIDTLFRVLSRYTNEELTTKGLSLSDLGMKNYYGEYKVERKEGEFISETTTEAYAKGITKLLNNTETRRTFNYNGVTNEMSFLGNGLYDNAPFTNFFSPNDSTLLCFLFEDKVRFTIGFYGGGEDYDEYLYKFVPTVNLDFYFEESKGVKANGYLSTTLFPALSDLSNNKNNTDEFSYSFSADVIPGETVVTNTIGNIKLKARVYDPVGFYNLIDVKDNAFINENLTKIVSYDVNRFVVNAAYNKMIDLSDFGFSTTASVKDLEAYKNSIYKVNRDEAYLKSLFETYISNIKEYVTNHKDSVNNGVVCALKQYTSEQINEFLYKGEGEKILVSIDIMQGNLNFKVRHEFTDPNSEYVDYESMLFIPSDIKYKDDIRFTFTTNERTTRIIRSYACDLKYDNSYIITYDDLVQIDPAGIYNRKPPLVLTTENLLALRPGAKEFKYFTNSSINLTKLFTQNTDIETYTALNFSEPIS